MTLIDNRDLEENNARRLRKRRRTGKFPIPPNDEDEDEENRSEPKLLKKDYATPFKLSRDYVPKTPPCRSRRSRPHLGRWHS